LGRIRPAGEVVTGAFRGEANVGAADLDGEAFGVVGPADGVTELVEVADGDAEDGLRRGEADGRVSWELATAVAAAGPASALRSGCIVITRPTRSPVTISPVVVPTISRRLRLRCRAA
jgi:hypothetical protein